MTTDRRLGLVELPDDKSASAAPVPPNAEADAAAARLARFLERARALEIAGRPVSDDSVREPLIPFAAALLAMRVRPALRSDWPSADPVHVAMFGGTNSGKSTVLNILLGRPAAEMHARAAWTQHPAAFRPAPAQGADRWLGAFPTRFDGYHRYENRRPPRQSDHELRNAQWRPAFAVIDPDAEPPTDDADGKEAAGNEAVGNPTVEKAPLSEPPGKRLGPPAGEGAVYWDAPDFSTEAARAYFAAVLDAAALADVMVMTVTDESYADDRAHVLLRMLADAGVPLHVVANKAADAPDLVEDIRRTMREPGRGGAPVHPLPRVSGADVLLRYENLFYRPESGELRKAVGAEVAAGPALKRRTLAGSLAFLSRRFDELLAPLAAEAESAAEWSRRVRALSRERLTDVYWNEYLAGTKYGEFNRSIVRLMELLKVPWIGEVVDLTRRIVGAPIRLLADAVRRAATGPETETRSPEEGIVERAVEAWGERLRQDAQVLAEQSGHPGWKTLLKRLDSAELKKSLAEGFRRGFEKYREEITVEVDLTARSIYEVLAKDPVRLNLLRTVNLGANLGAVALTIKSMGLDWSDAVLGPLVSGMMGLLTEFGVRQFVEVQKAELRRRQAEKFAALVEETLAKPASAAFPVQVKADEIDAARRDWEAVHLAAEAKAR